MKGRTVAFTIYGTPLPQGRDKSARLANGRTIHYTPEKTRIWAATIAAQAVKHRPEPLLDGPLELIAIFYLARPKSSPKSRKWPDTRPDLDNLEKAVTDALHGIVYYNDSRICRMVVEKRFGEPRIEISIRELDEGPNDGGTVQRTLADARNDQADL